MEALSWLSSEQDGGVEDEARLAELYLEDLPLVVLGVVGKVWQLELPQQLQWQDDRLSSSAYMHCHQVHPFRKNHQTKQTQCICVSMVCIKP